MSQPMSESCASAHPRIRLAALVLTGLAVLGGCAVTPEPMSLEAIRNRVAEDQERMYADQEPISGPLTFADVVARVMKNNLDFRLRMMEATLAQRQLEVGNWDMFPRLLANAGWVTRNNDSGGRSVSIETGLETLSNSSSQERTRSLGGLEFSWNVLDFGVSYYRAKSLADQALIAEERKRKVLQNLMQDTRAAYWRALGAQRLSDSMRDLMKRANVALARGRQIEQQGLLPQAQALAYQRALLDSTTLLQIRRQDLELARAELSALMNLPPGTDFRLIDLEEPELPPLPADMNRLETLALTQRPELREEDYRRRISTNDARRALVSVLPNLSFDLGYQYDSNRFLYNNSWVQAGLRVSADLFRLASMGSVKRANSAQADVDDARRMAQAMAVMTQVRVASLRYMLARDELATLSDSARVDRRLASFAQASASSRVDSELELIRTEARSLLSEYQRQIAYANAQTAWGRLYNSLGLDLTPTRPDVDLNTLSQAIGESMENWHRGVFARSPTVDDRPSVRLSLSGIDREFEQAVRYGLTDALLEHDVRVTNDDQAPSVLEVAFDMEERTGRTVQNGRWQMQLRDDTGKVLARARFDQRISGQDLAQQVRTMSAQAVESSAALLLGQIDKRNKQFAAH
ncbi:MAG: TolC family protein [Burkholderiaceae bacterium]